MMEAPSDPASPPSSHPRVLIVGVGNAYRSDDAVGLFVARRLRQRTPRAAIREEAGEGTALLEAWKNADLVVLVDAVSSGAEPGAIHRFDARARPLPAAFFAYSTHHFSVAEAIELARALNQLPSRLIVYGIEGREFKAGEGLSPEVESAAAEVEERILQEIQSYE